MTSRPQHEFTTLSPDLSVAVVDCMPMSDARSLSLVSKYWHKLAGSRAWICLNHSQWVQRMLEDGRNEPPIDKLRFCRLAQIELDHEDHGSKLEKHIEMVTELLAHCPLLSDVSLAFNYRDRTVKNERDETILPRLLTTLRAHPGRPRISHISYANAWRTSARATDLTHLSAGQLWSQAPLSDFLAIDCTDVSCEDTQFVLGQLAPRCSLLQLGQVDDLRSVPLPICTRLGVNPRGYDDIKSTTLEALCHDAPSLRQLRVTGRVLGGRVDETDSLPAPLPELRVIEWMEGYGYDFGRWVIARMHRHMVLRNLSSIAWTMPLGEPFAPNTVHHFFEVLQRAPMPRLETVEIGFALELPFEDRHRDWLSEDMAIRAELEGRGVTVSSHFYILGGDAVRWGSPKKRGQDTIDILRGYASTAVTLMVKDLHLPRRKDNASQRIHLPRLERLEVKFTDEQYGGKTYRPSNRPDSLLDWIEAPELGSFEINTSSLGSGEHVLGILRALADKTRFPKVNAVSGVITRRKGSVLGQVVRRGRGDSGQAAVEAICAGRIDTSGLQWIEE